MRVPSVCGSSAFWFVSFLIWAGILWLLSDGPVPLADGPKIPGADKVMHFGYFFGGGGLLGAALYLHQRPGPNLNWSAIIVVVTVIVGGIGLLDEWHQSWIPERSGNDAGDWLADAFGALAGVLVFRRLHHLLPADQIDQGLVPSS